ncbi:MAG: hypothetical protein Kow0097_09180 [Candidatus Bipolaricaulota bacterium]|nr:hypothetical protein [Candidatus Bipolaricaulota bacterium]
MRDKLGRYGRQAGLVVLLMGSGLLVGGCGLFDLLPPLPPDQAPTGVTASLGQYEDRIQVTWLAVERATSYRILRAVSEAGEYQTIDNAPSPTYTDTVGMENRGRLYWYKVQACNDAGCGPASAAAPGYAGYPPAPANVAASTTYPDKIVVTWDPVPGATYYQVYRDRNPDAGFPIVPGADHVTGTSFEDPTAAVELRYWYRVRACREVSQGTKCSELSNPAPGCRTPCLPPAAEEEI